MLIDEETIVLHDIVRNTTHQRMELLAVIESLGYIIKNKLEAEEINVYTDSQYVVGLPGRLPKLMANDFITKKLEELVNADLLKQFAYLLDIFPVNIYKVKAHLKETSTLNYNRKVDKLVRNIVRNAK